MKKFKMKFKNTLELTELPYFEKDENGRPRLAIDLPPIVDFHIHLGQFFLLSSPINLHLRTKKVKHCFREDSVPVDLSVYSGINLKKGRRTGSWSDQVHTVFTRHGPNATYTIPNSVDEMDRLGVDRSVVLAIDMFTGHQNSKYQLENTMGHPRFITFCGVNPWAPRWEAEMDECLELGARGLKVHPYLHHVPPNHPRVLRLLKRWGRSGLPVLFHTANNGLEPAMLRRLSDIELYEEPLRKFPDIPFIFGHGGMNSYKEAIELAKMHGNTWLEIGGHPPQNIRHMIDLMGNDRILFGTDWPWYPLVLPLAKVLIGTEDDAESRRKILSENAFRMFDDLNMYNTGSRVAQKAAAV